MVGYLDIGIVSEPTDLTRCVAPFDTESAKKLGKHTREGVQGHSLESPTRTSVPATSIHLEIDQQYRIVVS